MQSFEHDCTWDMHKFRNFTSENSSLMKNSFMSVYFGIIQKCGMTYDGGRERSKKWIFEVRFTTKIWTRRENGAKNCLKIWTSLGPATKYILRHNAENFETRF